MIELDCNSISCPVGEAVLLIGEWKPSTPPSLGLQVAVSDREREQGRFSGSNKGAPGYSEGANILARNARCGAAKGSLMLLYCILL